VTSSRVAFVAGRYSGDVWFRDGDGRRRPLTNDGQSWSANASPSGKVLVSRADGQANVVVLYDAFDGPARRLTSGPADSWPVFLPGGSEWAFAKEGPHPGIYKCSFRTSDCSRLTDEAAFSLSVDPDTGRIAYVAWPGGGRPPRVRSISPEGGTPSDISPAETGCGPVWTSATTIWISRRRHGRPVWVEMNPNTGQETGKKRPGTHECLDGPDPAAPRNSNVWIEASLHSEIRWSDLESRAQLAHQ
jgi:Tol biopolymer transport system component